MSDTTYNDDRQSEPSGRASRQQPTIPGYEILSFVKATSLANVWQALQISLERNVEIWVMRGELASDASHAGHFEEVYRAVSRIKHPNFAQIIDVSRTDEGVPYAVFEEIDGVTLDAELKKSGRIDQNKAAHVVQEIARVLDSAWKQCGFIHRNIKPDAVFLSRGAGVKITNFNCATIVKAGSNPLAYDGGMIVGTPNYLSPEQVERLRSIDFHADMYSAGALFYEMVTGHAPFAEEDDPHQVMELQRAGTLENPRASDKSLKPGFVYIMMKMMAKSPEDRYQWWQDVVEDIQKVLSGRAPYSQGGTYTMPLSTIGILPGDVQPNTTSAAAPSASRKVEARSAGSGAARSTSISDRYIQKSGPGCMTNLLSLLFIAAVVVAVGVLRIRNLEKPPAPAESDVGAAEIVSGATDAAATDADGDVDDGRASDGSGVQETTAVAEEAGASEDPAETVPPQKQLVGDIYRQLMEKKDFNEVRQYAQKRFQQVAQSPDGYDMDECKAIWEAFRDSARYEDVVGSALALNRNEREISVAGKQLKFSANVFANGELLGTATMPDGKVAENYRIKIADMTVVEMYAAMQAGVVQSDRQSQLARAFLTLKAKDHHKFKFYVDFNKLEGLKPFLEFANQ